MNFVTLATALATTLGDAITASVPVITIVLGATVGYSLFKRFIKG